MRRALALVVLLSVLAGGLAWLTRDVRDGDAMRSRLARALRDGLGVELVSGDVAIALLPTRIDVADATVRVAPALALRIERASADVALVPLVLSARTDVAAVRIDGPVSLRSGSAVATAVATGRFERRGNGAWRVALAGSLATGGTFALEGERDPTDTHLSLTFAGVDPAPLFALGPTAAARANPIAGRFDGSIELTSAAGGPTALAVSARSAEANLRAAGVRIDGPVDITATLDWTGELPVGPFEIDASDASVAYAGGPLEAAEASGATLRGVLVERQGATAIEGVRARVSALRAQVGSR